MHEQPQPSCEQGDISTTAAAKILSRAVNAARGAVNKARQIR
jgi:hypothetical protein